MTSEFDTEYYTYSKDKYIFIGKKYLEFKKLLDSIDKERVYYIFDLKDCKNTEEFYKLIKQSCNFPDYFGENPNAVSDCLMDYAYRGKIAFLEIINWLNFAELEKTFLYNLFDVIFFVPQEVKRLENINYYIYLDQSPDFNNKVIRKYKQNIAE